MNYTVVSNRVTRTPTANERAHSQVKCRGVGRQTRTLAVQGDPRGTRTHTTNGT